MSSTLDKLIRSANQIAAEFEHQQPGNACDATWDHLWHFWDPRMVAEIVAYEQADGAGLSVPARSAVMKLAGGRTPASQTQATEFGPTPDGEAPADAG
ncbi:formate dehydrogenase subunit delta [Brevundimonas sp.]|uniref:formate dehydrogenase subunit delta n=1 Tax=Brevundimonas sp. TaxID=1871086 RepID=UPI001A246D2B|nr:formate dehydrogenase subunit delta [Brevundimonas sp.]MBJ7486352.1 formate dehydrogenase subunit delta [Brevundimonas sp.]